MIIGEIHHKHPGAIFFFLQICRHVESVFPILPPSCYRTFPSIEFGGRGLDCQPCFTAAGNEQSTTESFVSGEKVGRNVPQTTLMYVYLY